MPNGLYGHIQQMPREYYSNGQKGYSNGFQTEERKDEDREDHGEVRQIQKWSWVIYNLEIGETESMGSRVKKKRQQRKELCGHDDEKSVCSDDVTLHGATSCLPVRTDLYTFNPVALQNYMLYTQNVHTVHIAVKTYA